MRHRWRLETGELERRQVVIQRAAGSPVTTLLFPDISFAILRYVFSAQLSILLPPHLTKTLSQSSTTLVPKNKLAVDYSIFDKLAGFESVVLC